MRFRRKMEHDVEKAVEKLFDAMRPSDPWGCSQQPLFSRYVRCFAPCQVYTLYRLQPCIRCSHVTATPIRRIQMARTQKIDSLDVSNLDTESDISYSNQIYITPKLYTTDTPITLSPLSINALRPPCSLPTHESMLTSFLTSSSTEKLLSCLHDIYTMLVYKQYSQCLTTKNMYTTDELYLHTVITG